MVRGQVLPDYLRCVRVHELRVIGRKELYVKGRLGNRSYSAINKLHESKLVLPFLYLSFSSEKQGAWTTSVAFKQTQEVGGEGRTGSGALRPP